MLVLFFSPSTIMFYTKWKISQSALVSLSSAVSTIAALQLRKDLETAETVSTRFITDFPVFMPLNAVFVLQECVFLSSLLF